MNIEILFLMLDAILVLLIVAVVFIVILFFQAKQLNDKLSGQVTIPQAKQPMVSKFKAVSKSAERQLDGEDFSFDVSEEKDASDYRKNGQES